jgi:putative transposase
VVLDAFSRRGVGWALEAHLTARLPLLALSRAIAQRRPSPGLVHHSDRGVQYASELYIRVLRHHGILPSMSRPANPYDNAACESFIKTLKREQIDAQTYRDIHDLRVHLEEFIDQYYNRLRLHSALNYTTPEEFEAARSTPDVLAGPTLSFPRHGEIYPPDVQRKTGSGVDPSLPALIGTDESPAGYSLTGCTPALPGRCEKIAPESESGQIGGNFPRLKFVRSAQKIWQPQMVWVGDYDGLDSCRIWSPDFRYAATQPEVKLP